MMIPIDLYSRRKHRMSKFTIIRIREQFNLIICKENFDMVTRCGCARLFEQCVKTTIGLDFNYNNYIKIKK